MTPIDKARQELAQAQDDFLAIRNREHTAFELALIQARLKKATRVYAEMVRAK